MCGRFVAVDTQAELMAEFAIEHLIGPDIPASWNVAPTMPVRIVFGEVPPPEVLSRSGPSEQYTPGGRAMESRRLARALRTVTWGLIPHWAPDPSLGTRMINARSETVLVKPAFRSAAVRRRCIVPANGYYEWMAPGAKGGAKRPYYLHHADGSSLAMAGLYERWRDPALPEDHPDAVRWTCAILTRSAPDALGHIHDRSPVLVPPDLTDEWLDCADEEGRDPAAVGELLDAMPPPHLTPREVGTAVGNVRNNSPSLIAPVATRAEEPGLF